MVEIAVQLESRAVFSDDHSLSVSLDVCALVGERHFDLAAVEAQAKTLVNLDLTSVTQDGKQLANNFSTGSFLFDDGVFAKIGSPTRSCDRRRTRRSQGHTGRVE